MSTAILSRLNIRPEEERLTLLLFLENFLLGLGFNFLETSAFPLFLVEFSPQTLPYIYMVNAVVVVVATWGYIQLGRRFSFGQQLTVTLAFLVVLVAAFWAALRLGAGRWVVFALPILFQTVVTLAPLGFWSMSNRLLTLRQSKRLIGPIGSGLWVAIVLTGFLIPRIVGWIGTVNLLVLSAIGLAVALILLILIVRDYGHHLGGAITGQTSSADRQRPLRELIANPYVALMFALTIVSWLAFFFVDNIFYNRVGAQFPSEAELSAFLGLYLAFLGLFTLFNNFVLTGFIINRFGVRAGLLVLPVSLFIVTGAMAVIGTGWGIVPLLFWLATLNKVLDLGFAFSVDQSAQTILYQALPAAERTRIQTIDTGIVRMIAVGGAGALLLLLNQTLGFDVVQLSYVLLAIVVLWLVGVFLTGRLYPQALLQALAKRRLTGITLTLDDAVTADAVRATLLNPNPGPALFALGLLVEHEPGNATATVATALAHPAAEVRREAIRRAAELGVIPALNEQVAQLAAADPAPDVRAAALDALVRSGSGDAQSLVRQALAGEQLDVRQVAIAGLLRATDETGRSEARRHLIDLVSSDQAIERLAAARIMRSADVTGASEMIQRLADDADREVRREALRAAAAQNSWDMVIAALQDPVLGQTAIGELVTASGNLPESAYWNAVRNAWAQADLPTASRVVLARMIARGRAENAALLLRQRIDDGDDAARRAVLEALRQVGYAPEGAAERGYLETLVDREVAYAALLAAVSRDCAPVSELDYLRRLAEQRFRAARDRVLLLLSLLYDPVAMGRVLENLESASGEKQSFALEVLDTTLPAETKARVMPLMDDISPDQRLRRMKPAYAQPEMSATERVRIILDASQARDYWLQVACVHAAGALEPDPEIVRNLLALAKDRDPLLRETATIALARLDPATHSALGTGEMNMLSTIEKVIILKDVELFSEMPDELLAEVASLLTEVELLAGQPVFAKGDAGDSLYIVVDGAVRVYDGTHTINDLGSGEVFGEMALLDAEPRMASVMAMSDTILLRLEQEPFYDLMESRSEVARGLIRVLSARLRNRAYELSLLRVSAE